MGVCRGLCLSFPSVPCLIVAHVFTCPTLSRVSFAKAKKPGLEQVIARKAVVLVAQMPHGVSACATKRFAVWLQCQHAWAQGAKPTLTERAKGVTATAIDTTTHLLGQAKLHVTGHGAPSIAARAALSAYRLAWLAAKVYNMCTQLPSCRFAVSFCSSFRQCVYVRSVKADAGQARASQWWRPRPTQAPRWRTRARRLTSRLMCWTLPSAQPTAELLSKSCI